MQIYGKRKYNAKKLRKIKYIYRNCNYSAPPMGMSNRLTVVLQQELH